MRLRFDGLTTPPGSAFGRPCAEHALFGDQRRRGHRDVRRATANRNSPQEPPFFGPAWNGEHQFK